MMFALPMAILAACAAPVLFSCHAAGFVGWSPFSFAWPTDKAAGFGLFFLDDGFAVITPAFLILFVLLHLGLILGWFSASDVGRDKDRPRLVEAAIMTGRGLLLTAPRRGVVVGPWLPAVVRRVGVGLRRAVRGGAPHADLARRVLPRAGNRRGLRWRVARRCTRFHRGLGVSMWEINPLVILTGGGMIAGGVAFLWARINACRNECLAAVARGA